MATAGFAGFSCSQLELEAEVDGASEQIELDDESFLQHYYSMLGGKLDSPSSTRKLGHNAYERDRRKKTNDLYSSLRSLLPESKQNKEKKVSIPVTISQVLKYIPELKAEVQQLSRRKEEMLLVLRRREEETHCVQSVGGYPLVSVTCLSNREIMVQLCLLSQDAMISLSGILSALDGEGLQLLNASTHTAEDGRCFCSLHLQAREAFKTDIFGDHLIRQIKLQEARAEYSGVAPVFMHM
ncbi:protein IRON-RELATED TRANSCRIPTION FACTOR 2-like [Curcuma longa]|uniref:protein IRON-RELATED TRANSCRIPTION FACTOR 2-like n=1 Tax=Curcuma longa TaxID=136217 RepID=UPI003D9DD6BB